LQDFPRFQKWLPTVRLCAFIFCFLHLMACVWHDAAIESAFIDDDDSWLRRQAPKAAMLSCAQ
jgi:hypothetical protein